jgi:hypothetical protein
MRQKKPILIWRLKDAPMEPFREDVFYRDEKGYRKWRRGKTGEEFVVMIPESWLFDDMDAAYELGLKVTEEVRCLDFSGEQNPDCEAFAHLQHGDETYDVYVIPSLTGRAAPTVMLEAVG